jgi:hypothetical protein
MAYVSLMVHVDLDSHLAGRVTVAADLANLFNAHLIGVAGGRPCRCFSLPTSRSIRCRPSSTCRT